MMFLSLCRKIDVYEYKRSVEKIMCRKIDGISSL